MLERNWIIEMFPYFFIVSNLNAYVGRYGTQTEKVHGFVILRQLAKNGSDEYRFFADLNKP